MKSLVFSFSLLMSISAHASDGVVELPVEFATTHTAALSTELRIGAGLGWTHYVIAFHDLHLGYGILMTLSPTFSQGTKQVYSSGLGAELEGRAYLSYGFDGTTFSFWPYFFVGPDFQLRFTKLNAFEDVDRVYAFDFGIRSGLGIKTRLGGFEVKIDLGAGYALSGINLKTTIMFGFGIF